MLGKAEKGPSLATVASDSRQRKSPASGKTAISRVIPPPFFHGIVR
jgi:hypothetical protein